MFANVKIVEASQQWNLVHDSFENDSILVRRENVECVLEGLVLVFLPIRTGHLREPQACWSFDFSTLKMTRRSALGP